MNVDQNNQINNRKSKNQLILGLISIFLGLIVLLLGSKLSISTTLNPQIPITGQSLSILLIGYYLHWRHGIIVIVTYLCLGAFGLPVFADGGAGLEVLYGQSAGFLWGFIPATMYMSLKEYGLQNKLSDLMQSFIIATVIILFCGVLWLSVSIGISSAIKYGFIPYWPGAVIKIIVALIIVYCVRLIQVGFFKNKNK